MVSICFQIRFWLQIFQEGSGDFNQWVQSNNMTWCHLSVFASAIPRPQKLHLDIANETKQHYSTFTQSYQGSKWFRNSRKWWSISLSLSISRSPSGHPPIYLPPPKAFWDDFPGEVVTLIDLLQYTKMLSCVHSNKYKQYGHISTAFTSIYIYIYVYI